MIELLCCNYDDFNEVLRFTNLRNLHYSARLSCLSFIYHSYALKRPLVFGIATIIDLRCWLYLSDCYLFDWNSNARANLRRFSCRVYLINGLELGFSLKKVERQGCCQKLILIHLWKWARNCLGDGVYVAKDCLFLFKARICLLSNTNSYKTTSHQLH